VIPWWTLLVVVPVFSAVSVAAFGFLCGSAYDRGYGDGHRAGWDSSRAVRS